MNEESFKDKYTDKTVTQIAKAYQRLRAKHQTAKEKNALTWKEVDYLRLTKIPEMLNALGTDSIRLKGVGTLSVRVEASCSTLDKDLLVDWLKSNDFEDLITKDTVNSSTLKAFINSQIKQGLEVPPDDVVRFTPFEMAVITK